MRVLRVSTGNMDVCSTRPATEPAAMYCQKARPSWVVRRLAAEVVAGGRRSDGWNLGEASAMEEWSNLGIRFTGRDGEEGDDYMIFYFQIGRAHV